jgi:hypothetical protein
VSSDTKTAEINRAAVAQIADGLGKCERDLLLGTGPEGWGAWVTATYEGMLGKGLARRSSTATGISITFDTPLAIAVIAHLAASA